MTNTEKVGVSGRLDPCIVTISEHGRSSHVERTLEPKALHGSSMTSSVELAEFDPGTPGPMHKDIGKLNSEYKKVVGQSTYRSIKLDLRED